jgi:hypothetical protein
MDEVLHANIFFVIASIASVVFCILISFILYHVLKVVKVLRKIIERIEAGSEQVAGDVANVRAFVSRGGMFTRAVSFFMGSKRARKRDED